MNSNITLHDIARAMGVSVMSVSRALNHRKGVSERTRERILSQAEKLGYRRNLVAQSLKTRATRSIGIMMPGIHSEFYSWLLYGIEQGLHGEYSMLMAGSQAKAEEEIKILQSFEERKVDGVIVVHVGNRCVIPSLRRLQKKGIPLLQLDRSFDEVKTDVVESDHRQLTGLITEHLVQLGHRQIYYLRDPRSMNAVLERMEGYRRIMRQSGLPIRIFPEKIPPAMARVNANQEIRGFLCEAVQTLLKKAPPPFGIVAHDIFWALDALETIEKAGLRCPQDVSLCGITGPNPLYRYFRVRITVAEWNVIELGRRAAELLLGRLRDPGGFKGERRKILLPGQLLLGNSTASPRRNRSAF